MIHRYLHTFFSRPARALILLVLAALIWPGLTTANAQEQPTRIVFASGPDDTGTVKRIIEDFNAANAGKIQVTWRKMDRDNNAHHDQLVTDFEAEADGPHLIAGDVIWTAEFARKGWVEDVTKPFYDDFDRADFFGPALDSATYRLRIWGVPWYSDTSVLFYRKDLLADSGFDAPPATWDELIDMSRKVMQDADVATGFVFQGADYEGGTANAVEFIWGAGGEVMRGQLRVTSPLRGTLAETDSIIIDSEEAAAGLDSARRLVAEGVAPAEVTTYREQEALEAFLAGDAVFLRSWPYVQGILQESELSDTQVGVAWLPAASADYAGFSCLGGWNLMIKDGVSDDERAAAWALIRYLTDPAQQKRQALEAGLLPVVESLYDDAEVLGSVPIAALATDARSAHIRVRPMSPFYAEMSSQIASAFNRVLKGELTGEEAVADLEDDLRTIVARNR